MKNPKNIKVAPGIYLHFCDLTIRALLASRLKLFVSQGPKARGTLFETIFVPWPKGPSARAKRKRPIGCLSSSQSKNTSVAIWVLKCVFPKYTFFGPNLTLTHHSYRLFSDIWLTNDTHPNNVKFRTPHQNNTEELSTFKQIVDYWYNAYN